MKISRDQVKSLVITLFFHGLLLLFLLLTALSTPMPLPEEEGVEVNLGNSEEGMGDIQPEYLSEEPAASPEYQPEDAEPEQVVTQDIEDVPIVEKKVEKKTEQKVTEDKPKVPEQPKVNQNALYKGKSNKTQGGNEGITGKPGDQGVPGGNPDSDNYYGNIGTGNLTYNLKGREPKYLPKPTTEFTEAGTVVVEIRVDKYGKVINAVAIEKGSNTTNTQLRKLAVQAARKSVFNANPDAPEEQKGTITYHFIISR